VSNVSEVNHISKEKSDWGAIRSCLTRLRVLLRCLLLMGSAYLAVYCSLAFCDDQRAVDPVDNASTAQSTALALLTKRPVTVPDSIQMTRLGDSLYADGWPSKGMVAKFSPDGNHFVVILKKGNLEANTNEYSLVLFQTAEVFQSPDPRVLVSLVSSSNRPAIDNVLWLDDNDTILFLGERAGEQTALYSVKCSSEELTKLTSHASNLTSFVTTTRGEIIVYGSESPVSTFLTQSVLRKGIVVTGESVDDLIRGRYWGDDGGRSLLIKRLGEDSETRIKVASQGRIGDYPPYGLSLSPDGAHLLIQTEVTQPPDTWSEYEDLYLKILTRVHAPNGDRTNIFQYELVDTRTGASEVLIDSPISPISGVEVVWSPDSKSVVVSNVYLPLNVDDPAERALRKAHTFLVEFKIPSRRFVKISRDDLRLLSWDSKTGDVICDVGRLDSLNGKSTPKAYFRKSGETWSKVGAPEQMTASPLPEIVLDEGMNTPPHIVAIDPSTGRKSLLMDLNPQFRNLRLARVEEVTWKDPHGIEVKGGLYWPPDYIAGKKFPLIIQTHGWDPDRFWMDGPWTTTFSAQALAGKGFFVLQAPDPDLNIWETLKEAQRAMAAYESAIDYLDSKGLIDRNRVGITAFSRTYWYITYMLTHSKYHVAAADIADGVDYSYFQYMALSSLAPGAERVFGGPPYGKSMSRWLKQSPAFLMDKIETPLRIQTMYPTALLLDWHWYTGLSRLGKPVEMIYIPEGTHVLEKPWDRMISQQGNVDWFCFWLKDEEDPDPAKVEQYKRWRQLRSLEGRTISTVSTP
jgi:hypothetical protein